MTKEHVIHERLSLKYRLHRIEFLPDKSYLDNHFHSEVEMVYVEKGKIACIVSGEEFFLPEGKLLFIGRSVIHKLKFAKEEAEVSYIQINIDAVCDSLFPDSSLFSYFCADKAKKYGIFEAECPLSRLFFAMKAELEEKKLHFDAAMKGCALQLVAFMAREGFVEDGSLLLQSSAFGRVLPALLYAKENYAERITLDELCRHLKVEKYNFCKQFKQATGTTFFDYLTHIRLKHAEALLTDGEKNITEIALLCGFSTVQYFNRVFSARYGFSPSAYRKMLI